MGSEQASAEWMQLADMPEGRSGPVCAFVDSGRLVCLGGSSGGDLFGEKTCFDTAITDELGSSGDPHDQANDQQPTSHNIPSSPCHITWKKGHPYQVCPSLRKTLKPEKARSTVNPPEMQRNHSTMACVRKNGTWSLHSYRTRTPSVIMLKRRTAGSRRAAVNCSESQWAAVLCVKAAYSPRCTHREGLLLLACFERAGRMSKRAAARASRKRAVDADPEAAKDLWAELVRASQRLPPREREMILQLSRLNQQKDETIQQQGKTIQRIERAACA
jgi:hypothetical protein